MNPVFSFCTNPGSAALGDSISAANSFGAAPAFLLSGQYRDYYQYGHPADYSGADTSIHYFGFKKSDTIGTRYGWLSLNIQQFIYLHATYLSGSYGQGIRAGMH